MCRVLILDDDKYFADTIKMILEDEKEAQPADVALNAQDAIKKVTLAMGNKKPYEVLLIDHRLGPGKDGIEVFKELRAISPDSDGIIFTGYDEMESGLKAYEAEAFRYLPKTANNQEMLFVFRALKQWRKQQREHNWQKIFNEVMEASIREKGFQNVAKVVALYSLKLGFVRAHLFWTPTGPDVNDDYKMLGLYCAGDGCIHDFRGHLYPLGEWCDFKKLKDPPENIFLRGEEIADLRASMEKFGYTPPTGEVILLPLWNGIRLLGILMLDYGHTNKLLSEHERRLLSFYAKQVALALENASLYTRDKKTTSEKDNINKISREITAEATSKSLNEVLHDLHTKISAFIDAANFSILLIDEETNELDFRLCYRENEPVDCPRKLPGESLEGFFIAHEESLLIKSGVADFVRRNGIQVTGKKLPSCWMGIPLRVNGKIIGGITLQKYDAQSAFTEREKEWATSIADEVAGAIQICREAEAKRLDLEKLNVLRRASVEMLQAARKDEDHLWHTALTIATANFGAGFNRALLFLVEEQTTLVGKAAIGTEDGVQARRDWQRDLLRNYNFDQFLADLHAEKLKQTDFEALIEKIEIPIKGRKGAIAQVLKSGEQVILSKEEVLSKLPKELTSKVNLSTCAILPLPAGKRILGVVIVDNKHNGKAIAERELDRLQTILNYAGLVWETLREQDKSETLLDVNQEIVTDAGHEGLSSTLWRICNAALGFIEADWDIIYPFKDYGKSSEFDLETTSYAGELKSKLEDVLNEKPSRLGLTAYIRKKGELIIPEINKDTRVGRLRLENHDFIRKEGIKALIGINIEDKFTSDSLGIIFLNYREPRQFSEMDIHHAKSFASLAAFAITNAQRMDEQKMRQRLEAALETAEVIGSSLEQEEMLRNVLEKLRKVFFKETTLCIMIYDDTDDSLKFAPATLEFYKVTNPAYRRKFDFPLSGDSIACKVARRALKTRKMETENVPDVSLRTEYLGLIPETQSELCISLMSSERKLLGVLVLERNHKYGFEEYDVDLVETVARQLSLGLERFQQTEQVTFSRTVSALTAWAADLAHELNNEAGNIQNWAYLIKEFAEDSLTINDYATQIEESAKRLYDAGLWNEQTRIDIHLDTSIQKYAERIAIQQSIDFELAAGAEDVYITINPSQFQRVLRHLIRNAARAMANKKQKKIFVRTKKLGEDQVEIQFEDFGPGVSEKVRPSLLKRDITTKGRGGYGLLITRQIIEDIDGSISLLPKEPGKGAVFSIKLPVAKLVEAGSDD